MKIRIYIVGILLLFLCKLNAQEQIGLRLDSYTGLHQAWTNPALPALSPTKVNINLFGFGAFFDNNYGFVKNATILSFRKETKFTTEENLDGKPVPSGYLVAELYDIPHNKQIKFNAIFSGPSFLLKIGEAHRIGVFTNFRSSYALNKIPENIGFYAYDRKPYSDKFSLTPFSGAYANWLETGIHYGFSIDHNEGRLSFGTNLKFNLVSESGFLNLYNSTGIIKVSKDTLTILKPDVEYGYTTENLDHVRKGELANFSPKLQFYGKGFSTDLGITYQVNGGPNDSYLYRIGFSILDLGITNIKQARVHASRPIPAETTIELSQFKEINTFKELEQRLSKLAFDDPTASLKATTFKLGMPTALSLQGDYQFFPNLYIGGLLVQPIGTSKHHLSRTAILAISPRFENRFLSMSLPIVLRDWQSMRLGLAARLGYLTIGTDNLGSFLVKKDFTGTDIYLALQFHILGQNKNKHRWGKRKKMKLGCYDF